MEQDQDQMAVMPGSSIEIAAVVRLGDKTGSSDSWGVPAAVKPNFKMKIAARMLGDSEVIANKLDVPVADEIGKAQSMPGFRNKMESRRQGRITAHDVLVISGAVVQPKTPQALKITLGNKTGPADSMGDHVVDQPCIKAAIGKLGDNGMRKPNKVRADALVIPEAFEAARGQNEYSLGPNRFVRAFDSRIESLIDLSLKSDEFGRAFDM